jgi:hypothetical protein
MIITLSLILILVSICGILTQKKWDISPKGDVAHYGMSDFYPETEKKLRFVLFWKIPFVLHGDSKKEIARVVIARDKFCGDIEVQVFQHMDNYRDLISDLYCGDSEISDQEMEEIESLMSDSEVETETDMGQLLYVNSSYDDIVQAIDELLHDTNEFLEDNADVTIAILRDRGYETVESHMERQHRLEYEDEMNGDDGDCGCTDCNTCDCECWNEDSTDA